MDDIGQRLAKCFRTVFPELPQDALPGAAIDTVKGWDSSHHFQLMQAVEEEFDIRVPDEAIGEIDSFASFENYLRANV